MDDALHNSLCHTKVDWYENVYQEMNLGMNNWKKEDILLCLSVQMDELVKTCDRYIELYNWGISRLGYAHGQS
uniref:Uncharacterized protein n=1 Tax=Pithovirus LCPAC202 TaxID=2506592 RepID=A0A481Z6G7_9VIRU|nr:MAG: hypothetical protein LCPAC202_03410 [Pithovirus LCPAC202]